MDGNDRLEINNFIETLKEAYQQGIDLLDYLYIGVTPEYKMVARVCNAIDQARLDLAIRVAEGE